MSTTMHTMNVWTMLKIGLIWLNLSIIDLRSEAACIKGEVDILFIIDSSTNIGSDDFDQELRKAANLAENFQIGPNATQFGLITFAVTPNVIFHFNEYDTYIDIEKAILNTSYLSGVANTNNALYSGRQLFALGYGARDTATPVALVFTNGYSSDSNKTKQEAALLKNAGVYVIVIALSNFNMQELQAIASEPKAVFQINNFNAILQALDSIVGNTCTQAPCIKGQLDMLYLIDSSSNIGTDNFNFEIRVAVNLAENFQIGPDAVQIGAITFADNSSNLFNFDTYSEFLDIQTALLHSQYLAGSAYTSDALENGRIFFAGGHGARNTATRLALVFTNGRSVNSMATLEKAISLKRSGVYIIAIALPNSYYSELRDIASEPEGVIEINNFNAILHAIQNAMNRTCNQVPCLKGQLDVLFLLDSSSSVGSTNFIHGQGVAANLAENFQIGPDNLQFAAISYVDNSYPGFDFTRPDYTSIQKGILNFTYNSGSANTDQALLLAGEYFSDPMKGGRISAPDVAIVITKGMSSDTNKTAQAALQLKKVGVYIIAIGYPGANRQELESIASDPNLVFDINKFSIILTALQDYNGNACN